jgi:predicted NBD/HSP70 family sugar kinase
MSNQTIGTIVAGLIEQGLVEETGIESRPGAGRNPMGLKVRPEGALAFGCTIERDRIDGAWIDLSGAPVVSQSLSINSNEDPQRTVQRVEELYAQLTDEMPASYLVNALPAIGLGMPGPFDSATSTLRNVPNFSHWEGIDPRSLFSTRWQLPIFYDNSATAAALGEAWQSTNDVASFLYCHWGVGIGGGLVIDHRTYRGSTGNSLELGHFPIVADGNPCDCGSRGCLEVEASVAAILRQAADLGVEGDLDHVVAAAASQPRIAAVLERSGQLLARAILGAVNLFDVDAVIIGGHHFQSVSPWMLPPIESAVRNLTMRRLVRPVTVRHSLIGEAAGAVGAASIVFDRLLPRVHFVVPAMVGALPSANHGL